MKSQVRFGADVLADDPQLLGRAPRVALVTNDAARTAADSNRRTRVALIESGIPLVKLFSPEHGLGANAGDGTAVGDQIDALTGLPVTSLYGARFAPTPELLRDVDVVLFDIPDVGARFYTFAWTLTHVIDSCAASGVPVIVLDRPNPLGGALETVEGPLLDLAHASFVGRHTIPIRHSLTLGEFGLLWRAERCRNADVRVIPCEGWQRSQLWPETGLPFVPTSPAIRRFEAALLYPGLCLFEASNVGVGRGSDYAFEAISAPWLDAAALADRFAQRGFPGVDVACLDEKCLRLMPQAAHAVRPVRLGIALLADVIALQPHKFEWQPYTTAVNPEGAGHFERLLGVANVRAALERNAALVDDTLLDAWTAADGWQERWRSVLQYE